MTIEKTIFGVLILAGLGFAAFTWEESRADRASLEKAIAIQQQIIDTAESREQSRDAGLKTTLSRLAAANSAVQTPQQIANALQQIFDLPQPIALVAKSAIDQPASFTASDSGRRRLPWQTLQSVADIYCVIHSR